MGNLSLGHSPADQEGSGRIAKARFILQDNAVLIRDFRNQRSEEGFPLTRSQRKRISWGISEFFSGSRARASLLIKRSRLSRSKIKVPGIARFGCDFSQVVQKVSPEAF